MNIVIDVDTEEVCRQCSGAGKIYSSGIVCDVCKGMRVVPTELGRNIIAMLKRRFNLVEKTVA